MTGLSPVEGTSHPKGESAMTGAELIAAERHRQVEVEGWTLDHDAHHNDGALVAAAGCYLLPPHLRSNRIHLPSGRWPQWPWDIRFWKPTPDDRLRELVKAGALIAAEIDRVQAGPQAWVEVRSRG